MTGYAAYTPDNKGFIRNWLACGPVVSPLTGLHESIADRGLPFGKGRRWILNFWAYEPESAAIKRQLYRSLPASGWAPAADPQLNQESISGQSWRYVPTYEDGALEFSRFNFTPSLLEAWAYAELDTQGSQTLQAEIHTIGPVSLWLNGKRLLHYDEAFSYVAMQRIPVTLVLQPGRNQVYLQGAMLGWREARLALGLRILKPAALQVLLPLGDIDPERWHEAETLLNRVEVRQFAFPDPPAQLWLDEKGSAAEIEAELRLDPPGNLGRDLKTRDLPAGRMRLRMQPGAATNMPFVQDVAAGMAGFPGENSLSMYLRPANDVPIQRHIEVWASSSPFSSEAYGDYDSRRQEALEHLAVMPNDVMASLAAWKLGHSAHIDTEAIYLACHFLENRYDCADFYAIALLNMLYRTGESDAIRPADRQHVEQAFLNFKYWIDEPGLDAMCYFTENHQILFHVSAYLAGQLWPDRTFHNSGYTGQQQIKRNQGRIEAWIRMRLRGGYSEWDSNAYMTLDAFAMLALTEFARSPRLRSLAAALLDKTFFMIACQSFKGSHSSTHGRCYVAALKSSRVENTSPLQRIAWGMGLFNGETRATGALALATNYRVPNVLQRIGADTQRVLVTQARSKADFRPRFDMQAGGWDAHTLTWRDQDVMLSAVLDHRPGAMGVQEHLWQATLSPEAVVFTTYPGNSQEHGNARPNFWAGSVSLPRVTMFERSVICLYDVQPDVGLGFTHAFFPCAMFDAWHLAGQWAFARYGNGYIGLWADGPLHLTRTGREAMQELRSAGLGRIWLACAGSYSEDGDFAAFQEHLQASEIQTQGLNLRWDRPQGPLLEYGWEGPMRVNGKTYAYDTDLHYANAYTHTALDDHQMQITHEGETITLDYRLGRPL